MSDKPDSDCVEVVVCPNCKHEEYWGMMHWRDGRQYCRHCIYRIWQKDSKWEPTINDYVFPLYQDGVDYTKK